MEHYFTGPYVEVKKPITVDGLNIEIDEDDRGRFKVVHLPITAYDDLVKQNEKLPGAQKMRITKVTGQKPITLPSKAKLEPKEEQEEEAPAPQPAKRGPKPKQNDLD